MQSGRSGAWRADRRTVFSSVVAAWNPMAVAALSRAPKKASQQDKFDAGKPVTEREW
jgi:hypothetical protein